MMFTVLLAAASASVSPERVEIPFSIFACRGDGIPTLVLDLHDDHRIVRFQRFGDQNVDIYLVEPSITVSEDTIDGVETTLISATGATSHSTNFPDGIPATLTLGVGGTEAGQVFSISAVADGFSLRASNCNSPPPPFTHLPEQIQ
jgi:hypothetical protein